MNGSNRIHPVPAAVAAALLVLGASTPACAQINTLKSIQAAIKNITKVTRKVNSIRNRCARMVESGDLSWVIDCSEDPVGIQSGAGTGDIEMDILLVSAYSKRVGAYTKLRGSGLPSEFGLDGLCSPASDVWNEIDDCIEELSSTASKVIFDLRFDATPRVLSTEESECRSALANRWSGLYRQELKLRMTCFKKNGLLGNGDFAEFFDCRAPASSPPGFGTPDTGRLQDDNRLANTVAGFYNSVVENCPDYLADLSFPGALTDPTGGIFSRLDLGQLARTEVLAQADRAADALFVGVPHCGDGNLDTDIGEECDDGNLDNCDGCDTNCTLPVCGNGIGCSADSEECDDGNAASGDGCDACTLEYCGDGVLQTAIGELCDDGNNTSGDGCSAFCQPD